MKKIVLNGKEREITKETVGVYAVWVGDYVYIGSGKLLDRVSGNPSKLRRNVHANKTLQEAYNKIGKVNVEVLEILDDDTKCREIEQLYIYHYNLISDITVCNKRNASKDCTSSTYNKYKRLTAEKVAEIKYILNNNLMTDNEIAEKYGCSKSNVSKIRTGFRWSNVEPVESL